MEPIVKDITKTVQTQMVTPDYQDKGTTNQIIDGLAALAPKAVDYLSNNLGKSGSSSKGSSSDSKDNSDMIRDYINLRKRREAGALTEEEGIIAEDNLAVKYGYKSGADRNSAMEAAHYTPFKAINEDYETAIANRQKSIAETNEAWATALMGDRGSQEERQNVAINAQLTSFTSQAAAESLKDKPLAEKKKIIGEYYKIFYNDLSNSFTATLNEKFGGVLSQEAITAFRNERVAGMKQQGFPVDIALKTVNKVLAPYDLIIEQSKTDINKAEAMNKAIGDYKISGSYLSFLTTSLQGFKDAEGNDLDIDGADFTAIAKISPEAAQTMYTENQFSVLKALGNNAEIKNLKPEDMKFAVSKKGVGLVMSTSLGTSKTNAGTIAEKAVEDIKESIKGYSSEEIKKNNYHTASAKGFNNMYSKLSSEDMKSIPSIAENGKKIVTDASITSSVAINKVTDGEGSLLVDDDGSMRYFSVGGGSTAIVMDKTDAGWLIPWGEQDAIAARDALYTDYKEAFGNMVKMVGFKEAQKIFNREAVKGNENLRRYANGLRQNYEYATETVHFEDLSLTNEEADKAASALLLLPKSGDYYAKSKLASGSITDIGRALTGESIDWLTTKIFEGYYNRKKEASDRVLKELTGEEIVDKNGKVSKVLRDPTGKVVALEQDLEDIKPEETKEKPKEETKTEVKDMFKGNAVQVTTFQRTKPETPVMLKVNKDSEIYSPFNGSVTFVSDFKSKPTLIVTDAETEESITLLGDVKGITTASKKIKEGDKIGTVIGEGNVEIQVRTPKDGKGFGYTRKNPRDYVKLAPPVPEQSPINVKKVSGEIKAEPQSFGFEGPEETSTKIERIKALANRSDEMRKMALDDSTNMEYFFRAVKISKQVEAELVNLMSSLTDEERKNLLEDANISAAYYSGLITKKVKESK